MWLLRVLSFASPIECRGMVVFYFWFRCVLVTSVGGVSSSAYASLDDGIACQENCSARTDSILLCGFDTVL